MPPCIDVYSLTAHRERAIIDRFLSTYVDLERSADRRGEELAVLPLSYRGRPFDLPLDKWETVEFASLEEVIAYGLAAPPRAFTIYLRSRPPWCGAILCFTRTGEIEFGVSLDDPLDSPDALATAKGLLGELMAMTDGIRGWAAGEMPPSLDPRVERPWEMESALAAVER